MCTWLCTRVLLGFSWHNVLRTTVRTTTCTTKALDACILHLELDAAAPGALGPNSKICVGNSIIFLGNSKKCLGISNIFFGNSKNVLRNSNKFIGNSKTILGNFHKFIVNSKKFLVLGRSMSSAHNLRTTSAHNLCAQPGAQPPRTTRSAQPRTTVRNRFFFIQYSMFSSRRQNYSILT